METTGQRFKQIRVKSNLAQEEFGKMLGLSKSAISAVENDKSFISIEIQRTLYTNYNINLNWLVCGEGNMYNNKTSNLDNVQEELCSVIFNFLKEKGVFKE